MTKYIVLSAIMSLFAGCAAQQGQRAGTTPTGTTEQGTVVLPAERYATQQRRIAQLERDRERLIRSGPGEEEQATWREQERARIRAELEAERSDRSETTETEAPPAPAPTPSPAPQPTPAPRFMGSYGPPGMVAETQAYAGGSAPWQRYGGATGGQEIIVRVNSAYAISLSIDGQMMTAIAGGMPLSVPAYTGGGITQVPVIPASRSGGWRGSHTTREYRVLVDSLGRRQLTWTCYSVASGRAGRPAGSGSRTINIRPGVRVLITDSMCR